MNTPLRHIGSYRILRKLADGGMGQIYLAQRASRTGFQKECAVKTIRPEFAAERRYADLFLREARVSALLSHQNIVQIFDADRDASGALYLAMEYVEGRNLREVLARAREADRSVPAGVALAVAREVLKGLDYAHRRSDDEGHHLGIVHRDLSPNNILISREGEVKIADFGIAKTRHGDATDAGELKGKFHYLAPELLDGRPADVRSDLYSLAVILYEMLTGHKPFVAESVSELFQEILAGNFPPLNGHTDIPPRLNAFLARALARRPEDRFECAADMRTEIEILVSELPAGASADVREYYHALFDDVSQEAQEPRASNSIAQEATGTGLMAQAAAAGESYPQYPGTSLRKGWFNGLSHKFATGIFLVITFGLAVLLGGRLISTGTSPGGNTRDVNHNVPSESFQAELQPTEESAAPTAPSPVPSPQATPEAAAQKKVPSPAKASPAPIPPAASAPFGRLAIGDLKPFAEVYVNNRYWDDTPTSLLNLPPGTHLVRLQNALVPRISEFTVQIKAGGTLHIFVWPDR